MDAVNVYTLAYVGDDLFSLHRSAGGGPDEIIVGGLPYHMAVELCAEVIKPGDVYREFWSVSSDDTAGWASCEMGCKEFLDSLQRTESLRKRRIEKKENK